MEVHFGLGFGFSGFCEFGSSASHQLLMHGGDRRAATLAIGAYFAVGIALTVYNKWLLSVKGYVWCWVNVHCQMNIHEEWSRSLEFHTHRFAFPVTMMLSHMVCLTGLSFVALKIRVRWVNLWRPTGLAWEARFVNGSGAESIIVSKSWILSKKSCTLRLWYEPDMVFLGWRWYFTNIVPIGERTNFPASNPPSKQKNRLPCSAWEAY